MRKRHLRPQANATEASADPKLNSRGFCHGMAVSRRKLLACTLQAIWMVCGETPVASESGDPNRTYYFNIESGDAAFRLNDFSTQSGLQILFDFESMKGIPITPIHGEYRPFDALDKIIGGTGIRYEFINRRTVTLTLTGELPPGMSYHSDGEWFFSCVPMKFIAGIALNQVQLLVHDLGFMSDSMYCVPAVRVGEDWPAQEQDRWGNMWKRAVTAGADEPPDIVIRAEKHNLPKHGPRN